MRNAINPPLIIFGFSRANTSIFAKLETGAQDSASSVASSATRIPWNRRDRENPALVGESAAGHRAGGGGGGRGVPPRRGQSRNRRARRAGAGLRPPGADLIPLRP